jgi:RNA polymerase-binding transcription factor DksA
VDIVLDRRLMRQFGLVERALAKIGEGTYGHCDATGDAVPVAGWRRCRGQSTL